MFTFAKAIRLYVRQQVSVIGLVSSRHFRIADVAAFDHQHICVLNA